MIKRYVLDGYNVIGKIRDLPEIMAAKSLSESRDALIWIVAGIKQNKPRLEFTIVFDGKSGEISDYCEGNPGGIKCHFTKRGEEADDYIGAMLRNAKDPSGIVVISDDNKVRNKCRVYGVTVESPSILQKFNEPRSSRHGRAEPADKNISQQDAGEITTWYKEAMTMKKKNSPPHFRIRSP